MYAELCLGTIASCLPVLPKFFRHISPKISGTFTHKLKSGNRSRPTAQFFVNDGLPRNLEKDHQLEFIGSTISEGKGGDPFHGTWSGARSSSAKVKREYLQLSDQHVDLQQCYNGGDKHLNTLEGAATKRDDLEIGHVLCLVKTGK